MLKYSKYSNKKIHENLYISKPIKDQTLKDTNHVLVRLPDSKKLITDVILSFDGQNLFDKEASYYGIIFNLEKLLREAENDQKKNILVIALSSNSQRQIQYNPYPRENSEVSLNHLKMINSDVIPSVLKNFNLDISGSKKHVLGASMGALMAIKFSIVNSDFNNVICLSPAFWFGFPGVLKDIKKLNKNTFLYLYTGKKEGHVFGDHVKNIFPKEWELDFSTNDKFYVSGVNLIKKYCIKESLQYEYSTEEEGMHNETYWAKILGKYLKNFCKV